MENPPAFESGIAEVSGTRLYYEIRGTGPALLFLHGFTLDRRMWNRQVGALASSYRTVAYDARGFGESAMPGTEPYRHCDDAAALCEYLGLDQVVAIGHSIGAHQTLEFALTRPDLVVGWVSVCCSGLGGVPFPDDIRELFALVRRAARGRDLAAAKTLWGACPWFESARAMPTLASELDEMLRDYSGWHWVHDNPAKNIEPSAAERLQELEVPALVITGGRDLAYNTVVGESLVRGIPRASSLRIADAGHMANMEQAHLVTRAIARHADRAIAELK